MTIKSLRASIILIAIVALGGCSNLPTVDQYFTFNVVRSADFSITNAIVPGSAASITASGRIDTVKEYQQNGTSAYLLRTAKVTRIQLVSSDPTFNLSNLTYATLLIGADTIADSLYQNDAGEFMLTATVRDVTAHVRDTSYAATLNFSLRSAISTPVTVRAYLTFVNTALPQ